MQKQSGNFLLQALLALTLVFSFMPFLAKRLANRDMAAQMYSAKQSIETVYNAARLYLHDNKDKLNYGETVLEQSGLVSELAPYGLPLGFNPVTSLNQDIVFVINISEKNDSEMVGDENAEEYEEETHDHAPRINAVLYVLANDDVLTEYQTAELARMIGFFARPNGKDIEIKVPVDVMYTDIVLRKETGENVGFLTALDMGGNNIESVGALDADQGTFFNGIFRRLDIEGTNSGPGDKNKIKIIGLRAASFDFRNTLNNLVTSLTIDNGNLNIGGINSEYANDTNCASGNGTATFGSIGRYGRNPNLDSETVDVYDFLGGKLTTTNNVHWSVGNDFKCTQGQAITLSAANFDTQKIYGTLTPGFGSIAVGAQQGLISAHTIDGSIEMVDRSMANFDSPNSKNDTLFVLDMAGESSLPDINVNGFYDVAGGVSQEAGQIIPANPETANTGFVYCGQVLPTYFLQTNSGAKTDYNPLVTPTNLISAVLCNYIFWERWERKMNKYLCEMAGYCGMEF